VHENAAGAPSCLLPLPSRQQEAGAHPPHPLRTCSRIWAHSLRASTESTCAHRAIDTRVSRGRSVQLSGTVERWRRLPKEQVHPHCPNPVPHARTHTPTTHTPTRMHAFPRAHKLTPFMSSTICTVASCSRLRMRLLSTKRMPTWRGVAEGW